MKFLTQKIPENTHWKENEKLDDLTRELRSEKPLAINAGFGGTFSATPYFDEERKISLEILPKFNLRSIEHS
ncbi:hypothetical protein J6590_063837 [Homalodisca vitripennis]|nr:hypothetical protein J6590_063837 [Homalodisca vitripennis]